MNGKSYFLYFYENQNKDAYLERIRKNKIKPTTIEQKTILDPDEYDKKWEKIRI